MVAARLLQEPYVKRHKVTTVTQDDRDPAIDWSSISSNVIATVLGAAVIAVVGAIFFTAYQVPRQQDVILRNQEAMKETITGLGQRLDRIEANDRRQDERIIRGMK
jgi:hypothetical protein